MAHKKVKKLPNSEKRYTGRQTDIINIRHTSYNTLKLPNMKYVLDQLIVINVNTTVKSNLCIMDHSVKGW